MTEGIAFLVLGLFILACAGFRWSWFMNSYKVKRVVRKSGMKSAIKRYVVYGSVSVIIGILWIILASMGIVK